jgi:hypothetical protein
MPNQRLGPPPEEVPCESCLCGICNSYREAGYPNLPPGALYAVGDLRINQRPVSVINPIKDEPEQ